VTTAQTLLTIAGLGLVTLVTRAFFFLSQRELPMPRWLLEGLRYAPVAALAAVIAPEVLMTDGRLIDTWRDARIFGALAGLAFYAWRGSLFGTIACGTGVMLALRFGLGW